MPFGLPCPKSNEQTDDQPPEGGQAYQAVYRYCTDKGQDIVGVLIKGILGALDRKAGRALPRIRLGYRSQWPLTGWRCAGQADIYAARRGF